MSDFVRLHNKSPWKFLPRSSPPLQPPVNLSPPVVSGVNAVGSLLSVTAGAWSGDPSFAYQWQISADGLTGWSDIAGATAATYAPVAGDASQFIRAIVTATNAAGTGSAESNEVGPILRAPVNTGLPVITGTARVDEILTVSTGAWAAFPAPSFTYQWQRGTTNIPGATSSTYLITDADAGSALRCIVTATNAAGSASATSAATAVVLPFDWEWAGFDLTAGSDGVQWVGYSDGGATRPQPAFGSISGQPTPRTDLLALYDDTASGVFLAVFAGDFTARLAGIEVRFGGFVMDAFEVELIDGNTWARFIGFPGDLTPAAVYQVAFGFNLQAAPIITEQPSITPASGRAGTRFVFDVGAAEGRPVPVANFSLTFNGAPVALDPEGGYTPSLPGSLVWSVEWSNGIAPDASAQATAEVEVAFTPAELFEGGQAGFWPGSFDPAGARLWQEAAGTTPATLPGAPVGKSDSEAGTIDASQAVALSRPTLVRWPKGGRHNLALHTEDLTSSDWLKAAVTVTMDTMTATGAAAYVIQNLAVKRGITVSADIWRISAAPLSARIGLLGADNSYRRFLVDLQTGAIETDSSSLWLYNPNVADLGGGRYRASFSVLEDTGLWDPTRILVSIGPFGATIVGSSVGLTRVQVQATSQPHQYQKVTTASDITEAGVPDVWHLFNDGGDSLNAAALPAGPYGLSFTDEVGAVTVQSVTSDGATPINVLRANRQADVILRQGEFSAEEEAEIRAYWEARYG